MSGFENSSIADIGRVIQENQRFAVVSHARPDGDAIGSTAALGLSLRAMGKRVEMINADGVPERLKFLPMADEVRSPGEVPPDFEPQVGFVVDSADLDRVGATVLDRLGKGDLIVNIDHHLSNPGFGNYRLVVADSPATGQIVYELIRELGLPLSEEGRDHLWAAISTDTGSFQYPNTTARTFEIAAELLRAGANVGLSSQELYESFPFRRIEVLRELLNVLKLSPDGRVASWLLSREVMERLGLLPDDTEGLIDVIRGIKGVVVAVFFQETEDGGLRVSCRSKNPEADVSRVCAGFGGGGHRLAAGARLAGPVEEAEKEFLDAIHDSLEGKY